MTAPGGVAFLPEADREMLREKGCDVEADLVEGFLHVIIHGFELPAAYTPRTCDLLVRLPPGYPNAHPDMFWTRPDVKLTNGNWPMNSDYMQDFAGQRWQRWSRHFPGERWRAGTDGLDTYLASIRRELRSGR